MNSIYNFEDIISTSSSMQRALKLAHIAAKSPSTVLITGASGTGKEMIANAIHNASTRRDRPFIAINCGAIPHELIGSELFGYEGGAFTGANPNGQKGKFELAQHGTIFLDEIGDMPLELQASILRALESKEFYRIGGQLPVQADVRIIAATNRDLPQMIRKGQFREDLYYRLNILRISIAPLKDRIEDVRPLADHFLDAFSGMLEKRDVRLDKTAYRFLESYSWPGNIRELKNIMERVVNIVEDGAVIDGEILELMLEPELSAAFGNSCESMQGNACDDSYSGRQMHAGHIPSVSAASPEEKQYTGLEIAEREFIQKVIADADGNIAKAAALAGVSRRTVYRKCDEYDIDYHSFRQ